jgi:hypothetical protein
MPTPPADVRDEVLVRGPPAKPELLAGGAVLRVEARVMPPRAPEAPTSGAWNNTTPQQHCSSLAAIPARKGSLHPHQRGKPH